MRLLLPTPHHRIRLQHLVRPHDDLHSAPPPFASAPPAQTQAILCGVFSLGFLVILSAILNRYYNFTAGYGSLIYLNWYVGEAATSVFVANVPHLWPLLSRAFALGAFFSSSSRRRTTQEGGSDSAVAGGEAGGTYGKMGRRKSRSRILGSR
ncbi:MAG: hypothetical protein Q9173_007376, partial [Seirophora scorigena]